MEISILKSFYHVLFEFNYLNYLNLQIKYPQRNLTKKLFRELFRFNTSTKEQEAEAKNSKFLAVSIEKLQKERTGGQISSKSVNSKGKCAKN